MRLTLSKSKNSISFYIIKSVTINGKRTSKIFEKLGTLEEVKLKAKGKDPYVWAKEYLDMINKAEKENNKDIVVRFSKNNSLKQDQKLLFNGGYLFLQNIYYDLGLNDICDKISNKYQFKYDLNNILSNLIYSRVIYPSSKLKTLDLSKQFIEQPNFDYQHILRALEVISKEINFIQSELYKNSLKISKRNDKILFYDCTNYYFEIENDDDFRKYGKSKENRPNPIVGMGLFLDGDGIPLAFSTFPGNTNEQVTLKPLEETIINDFNNSKFVVCTDAGLASTSNRKFNNTNNRRFITTQSLKKLKSFIKDWSLDLSKDWKLPGSNKTYDISKLKNDEQLINAYYDKTFYKERWIKENDLEQRLIITFSSKYQEYQKRIREKQISRALKIIDKNPKNIKTNNENDPKRFIESIWATASGEVASKNHHILNHDKINDESKYDGLYAVCTNLEDPVEEIIRINKQRWEIEESFKIMKSEFKARPVFLSRDDRISAHFTVCFLSLIIFRYLEKKLQEQYTAAEIVETLRNYNFREIPGYGYIPTYTYSNVIKKFNETFDFDTAKEIVDYKNFKKIFAHTKI
ncbi:MAG: IS1634 family transposase [Bacilli bacterium]|nr:IS1634 family transposase [Bacilli bacterium]